MCDRGNPDWKTDGELEDAAYRELPAAIAFYHKLRPRRAM
jgi:hypothetical protein